MPHESCDFAMLGILLSLLMCSRGAPQGFLIWAKPSIVVRVSSITCSKLTRFQASRWPRICMAILNGLE